MVFLVLVLRDTAVVHDVEESGETDRHLNERSDSTVLGETVLVVPAPVSPNDKLNISPVSLILLIESTWTEPAHRQWDCRTDGEQARQAAGRPSPEQSENQKMEIEPTLLPETEGGQASRRTQPGHKGRGQPCCNQTEDFPASSRESKFL